MKDLKNRLSKFRGAFNKLKEIWISNNILRKTNVRLYKTLVVPVLIYGSETWKMNKGDDKAVDVFHSRCLRRDPLNPMGRPCQYQRTNWKEHS